MLPGSHKCKAKKEITECKALVLSVMVCLTFAMHRTGISAQQTPTDSTERASDVTVSRYGTAELLRSLTSLDEGALAETAGFYAPGDGGEALYRIQKPNNALPPNGADVIALKNGRVAVLLESEAVNYRMFGAVGDGQSDDGVQIKLAHGYANRRRIPVVNLSGEFWIKQVNNIEITTNVHWGHTTFHIDERFNHKRNPRFVVLNDEPTQTLELDEETKAILLAKIRPGVQIIDELAPYAGCLFTVEDVKDRIGIRAGNYSKRGWAREELFYVEEEGRIIGDIAWEFKDFTSVRATACNNVYLIIEGGGFRVSGDTPAGGSKGYHHLGISIQRSRTIVREQWVGLEKGHRDVSMEPRSGFYELRGVYDVTLENIRAMPWEKNRRDRSRVVAHGTYGISGARMLNCTFRNLTAEGGWVAWGVFGTNLNKNFRIENCRLNRIDVHFHCWNLYIRDCTIGFKGITITGGGDLFVTDTTRDGNSFISFRRDYGAKWDGRIRLRGCTLKPTGNGTVSVLNHHMADFDYQYPIGFGRSVIVEDMLIDYSAAPESTAPCWLMDIVPFSRTETGARLFFPSTIEFSDVRVEGREQGVRLLRIPNPHHYDLRRKGRYDGSKLEANCTLVVDDVQLEKMVPKHPNDTDKVHLLIGAEDANDYADQVSLFPEIHYTDCDNVSVYLGNCIASAFFDRCSVNTVTAPGLQGELVFRDCRLQPNVQEVQGDFYTLESTLGTRFTNCTVHAPIVNGIANPELVNRTGFIEINGTVRHYHLNTALGSRITAHYRHQGTGLNPDFIAMLKLHHEMEE
ncbi:MAG: hypothetical protein JSW66_10205 [Phycisphaerales bacterium]|nr:MAG: hypothetical protein JSW66_10205 [Phycisphaerales bacterium]